MLLERRGRAPGALAQPVLMERDRSEFVANAAEGMEVAMPGPDPIGELDAQLERAAGGGDEGVLIQSELPVEVADRRNGCLADANGTDGRGLDDLDTTAAASRLGEGRRRHPAGGS